jgi:hypothetical protein
MMKKAFIVFFSLLLSFANIPNAISESNLVDEFGNKSDVITNSLGEVIPAPEIFRPCGMTISKQCIKSISATDANGKVFIAKPSGTLSYQWQSGLLVNVPDWELTNKNFLFGSNLFGISISQIPNDLKWRSANGFSGGDLNYGKLQVFIYPHFKSKVASQVINFAGEATQRQCGSPQNSELCFAPPLFGESLNWKIQMYVDPIEPGVLWGRSISSNYKVISKANSDNKFDFIEISGKNIEYPDFVLTEIRNRPILERKKSDYSRDYLVLELNYKTNNYTRYIANNCVNSFSKDNYVTLSSNAWSMENPKWNSLNSSLEIKLNSPSYTHLGAKTVGYLELEIPQALAKCLWDIKSNSISKLDVEVFYDQNNEKQVVSLIQTSTDRSIRLVANNFHYSSPTFAFKMPKAEKMIVQPKTAQSPGSQSKKVISCTKGKVTKKVTGTNPKCPSGYKKVQTSR